MRIRSLMNRKQLIVNLCLSWVQNASVLCLGCRMHELDACMLMLWTGLGIAQRLSALFQSHKLDLDFGLARACFATYGRSPGFMLAPGLRLLCPGVLYAPVCVVFFPVGVLGSCLRCLMWSESNVLGSCLFRFLVVGLLFPGFVLAPVLCGSVAVCRSFRTGHDTGT